MKDNFEKTLNILKELDFLKNNNVYLQNEIEEERENINDIIEIEKRFKIAINKLENIDKKENDEVIKNLIDLHLSYSDFIWQYEQMHEMIKKMISQYR
ncbi:hypothetical protein NL50_09395 [Clostridium acetobutylicum]|nr:hypothetical protein NL50_09395 [Clostridium acetobutylicum]